MKRKASEKYISRPVTSTSVATKGADEVAGSAPSFFRNMGSMEPVIVPHNTTPISEKPTVRPIMTE